MRSSWCNQHPCKPRLQVPIPYTYSRLQNDKISLDMPSQLKLFGMERKNSYNNVSKLLNTIQLFLFTISSWQPWESLIWSWTCSLLCETLPVFIIKKVSLHQFHFYYRSNYLLLGIELLFHEFVYILYLRIFGIIVHLQTKKATYSNYEQ